MTEQHDHLNARAGQNWNAKDGAWEPGTDGPEADAERASIVGWLKTLRDDDGSENDVAKNLAQLIAFRSHHVSERVDRERDGA